MMTKKTLVFLASLLLFGAQQLAHAGDDNGGGRPSVRHVLLISIAKLAARVRAKPDAAERLAQRTQAFAAPRAFAFA